MLNKKYPSLVLTALLVGIISSASLSGAFAISNSTISTNNTNKIVALEATNSDNIGGQKPPAINNDSTQEQGSQQGFPGSWTVPISWSGIIWTKLLNVCSGLQGGDADGDFICDNWENPSTPGNSATARYVKCPKDSTGAFMDVLCTDIQAKYNLCINDAFASVWGNKPDGTQASPTIICPKLGHKDVYVEFDFMAGRDPDPIAIKDVIKSFGNSPVLNAVNDDFGRSTGITLHVVRDEALTSVPPVIWAWQDPSPDNNFNNDFKSIKERHFGLNNNPLKMPDNPIDERAPCPPISTCSVSTIQSTLPLLLKHYVYHYNTFVANWQGNPLTSCGPSGTAETLGNDFIVSLGCGFYNGVGTKNDQAGTFMHELGHNLNLGHGGPLVNTPSFPSSQANTNCKPNELSVMSWTRQVPSTVTAANWETYHFLDYSRAAITTTTGADLKEGTPSTPRLVEIEGLKLPSGFATNLVVYATPGLNPAFRSPPLMSPWGIDWNGNGGSPAGTWFVDVNDFGLSPQCVPTVGASPDGQVFKSMDEWNNLSYNFLNDGDGQDGVTEGEQFPELTGGMVQNLTKLRNQFTGLLDPINSNGSSTFIRGDIIPVRLQLRDLDGKFMVSENVTFSAQRMNGSLPNTSLLSSYPVSQFGYDNSTNTYLFNWPTVNLQDGIWGIRAILNITSTNTKSLLQGPPPTPSGMTGLVIIKP
jgi:hypothetical protein